MGTSSWLKAVVVGVGLFWSAGAASAAGPARPGPSYRPSLAERILEQRDLHGRSEVRAFELAQAKVNEGKALRVRGEALRERARRANSLVMGREAQRLIQRGEAIERAGRLLLSRIRS